MCRHKLFLIMSLLLITMCLSGQDIYRVTASSSLNVRKQPSTSAAVLGRVLKYEEVVVLTKDDDWAEIIWKDDLAYASSKYIEYVSPLPLTDTLYTVAYEVVNVSDYVNVRSEPSLSSPILGTVTRGTVLISEMEDHDWIAVLLDGDVGYISTANLKRVLLKRTIEKTFEPEPQCVEVVIDTIQSQDTIIPFSRFNIQEFVDSLPSYIVSIPKFTCDNFDLFLSARVGMGGSSYSWDDGPVSGKFSFSLDAVSQFYLNEKLSFLPKGYYAEGALGYALKGAASFPMHYFDLHLIPLGYYYDWKEIRFLGKIGVYTGFPISTLRYVGDANADFGISCGAAVEYRLLSAGLTFERGFTRVAPSPVELYNWGIVFQMTFKILSFNQ